MKLSPPKKLRRNTMQQPFAGSQKQRYVYNETELHEAITDVISLPTTSETTLTNDLGTLSYTFESKRGFEIILAGEFTLGNSVTLSESASGVKISSLGQPLHLASGVTHAFTCEAHEVTFENIFLPAGELVRRTTNLSSSITHPIVFFPRFLQCRLSALSANIDLWGAEMIGCRFDSAVEVDVAASKVSNCVFNSDLTANNLNIGLGSNFSLMVSNTECRGDATFGGRNRIVNLFVEDALNINGGSTSVLGSTVFGTVTMQTAAQRYTFVGNYVTVNVDVNDATNTVVVGNHIAGSILNDTGSGVIVANNSPDDL